MDDLPHWEQLRAAVELRLASREVIVWIGQPRLRRFRGEVSGEVLLGLIATAAGAFAMLVIVGSLVRRWNWEVVPAFLVPGIFLAIGYHDLRAPGRYRRVLEQAVYAVTSERAILVNGFGYSTKRHLCDLAEADRSFNRAEVRRRVLKRWRRDGSGDIVFDGQGRLGGRNRRYWVEIGFFGIDDVGKVDEFLDRLAPPGTRTGAERDRA